ncbi:MAG: 2-oxoglutarate dehydrogenase complex dihydrolipoyllysine-residue succinyltransferase, partial [Proteobacteria bacterium]|nr:2-oxoglutarate dehydrogenase complex dihydrolipoyllysine-residue succinyltransferase [Pseudomonadota bacterium]
KLMDEKGIAPGSIAGTGKDGRVTKGDVLSAGSAAAPAPAAVQGGARTEERVKMSKLRQVIAKRLKDSQNTAAILTTFNEIDMSNVIALRNDYKDAFEKKYGLRLGFMGFFVKAACHALKEIPAVNAQIDGDELIFKNYCDVGVAVGTDQGLVVPVVRGADQMSIMEIEADIARLAKKAREGTLTMGDMSGGTFTVSNGGVYGSLMSTPIINPPQSGILGMHKTEERPIAVKGQVVIRPMMYVALSYDHRIIDGKESVTFLVRIKEAIEDPRRLLLGL